ncbi:serine/threonine-protein phosphatase 4 regulatory subunit 3B-like [Clavelina lepadiformis]|uniref:serine/threonine-protein phosphatase 4 regulatory subunit 3B-like n=1 Tax=Clavelina lepadiformis TaxID=159417 RepID=UPI004042B5C6
MADTRRRVKVYTLNEDRQWDDCGTGHVSAVYTERLKGLSLQVRAEQDGSLLLESRILSDTAYQKQQETLIVWSEGENTDLALSFQEKAGCDEIWEKICEVQGKDPSVDITQDIGDVDEEDDEIASGSFDNSNGSLQRQSTSPYVLPACELGELEEIADLFSSALTSLVRREQLARAIEESDYIPKLLTLFHTCEDLENTDGLHRLYEIMKSIFLLNKSSLFDVLLQEGNIMDVVGCLEHDPALMEPQKHREYLLREVSFKEVLPIQNPDLKRKIHQTFRLQYIQDVVLPTPSVFEENMLSTLSSLIFFNKAEIVHLVQSDENLLSLMFKQLREESTADERRRELAGFVRELCSLSQTLQPAARDDFFRRLSELGVLPAVEMLLASDDTQSHKLAIDVFAHVVEHSPSMVRDFAHHEMNESCTDGDDDLFLLNLVIEQMICDPDPELSCAMQLTGLLRVLLDPENMMPNKNEKTEFLGFFYRNCMHVLMAPLLANTADEKRPGKDDYQTAHLLSLILDLVTFSVEHHTYHVKNYILNKDLLRRVLVLLNSKHTFLSLAALRFMRRIISTKDEFYNRYIIKGDLFDPVVEALFRSAKRYNLLNSTILETFEYIRVEDIKSLIEYIVEKHYKRLQSIEYVKTFSRLKLRYDQQKNRENHKLTISDSSEQNHRFRRDARSMEEEEELWFEKDDDDALTFTSGDSFETQKINIDSILEGDKAEVTKKLGLNAEDKVVENVLKSNGIESEKTTSAPCEDDVTVKNGLVGLVDYSDDESEEEEDTSIVADVADANKTNPSITGESETLKDKVVANDAENKDTETQDLDMNDDKVANEVCSDEPARKKPRLLEVVTDD